MVRQDSPQVPRNPIPDAVIDSVKNRSSFLSLLKSYGIPVTRKGSSYLAICPFHKEKTPSLSIDLLKNLYNCFGCNAQGNIIQFVQEYEHIDFRTAVEKLLAIPHKPKDAAKTKKTEPVHTSILAQAFQRMVDTYNERPEGKKYIEQRRGILSGDTIQCGYCPSNFGVRISVEQKKALMDAGLLTVTGKPHFSGCVVFPLRDIQGKLTGLYGRKCTGDGHYYLKGERTGVFSIHDDREDTTWIVESVIDAISLYCRGIASVLALHGINGYTASHEHWLQAKRIKTVCLLLDGDTGGREASQRLAEKLKQAGYKTYKVELPGGEDPNSFFSFAAHTLEDLKLLPGYPKTHTSEGLHVHHNGEDIIIQGSQLTYTIRGLTGYGLDRLRVTIRAARTHDQSAFHIDNLDLYHARGRTHFIDSLCNELACTSETIAAEIKELITVLEKQRLAMRQETGEKQHYTMSESEKQEALTALKSDTLLQDIIDDFDTLGMVGEENAKLLCYLGTVSRLLSYPLGVLIISRSGAGKTTLQEAACSFVPEESLVKYTRLTGQALFYKESESLKHKVLAIEEEEGMQQAIYAIRTLQSSQCLRVAATRSDPKTGKLKTEEYTVEGPVFIFIATTNPDALDAETKNRFIILTIDESTEQTKRIMDMYRYNFTLAGKLESRDSSSLIKRHQNMQRLLKPVEVINNFAPHLDYAFDRLQMRRELRKYFTLIESVALLRQYRKTVKFYTKEGKEHRYIEVDKDDIAVANKLADFFFRNSLDELAPHTRSLAGKLTGMIKEKGGIATFTRKELRDFSGWSDWSVRQGLNQLENLGYITRKSGCNGVRIVYELLIDATAENRAELLLTATGSLQKSMKKNGKKTSGHYPTLRNLVRSL